MKKFLIIGIMAFSLAACKRVDAVQDTTNIEASQEQVPTTDDMKVKTWCTDGIEYLYYYYDTKDVFSITAHIDKETKQPITCTEEAENAS